MNLSYLPPHVLGYLKSLFEAINKENLVITMAMRLGVRLKVFLRSKMMFHHVLALIKLIKEEKLKHDFIK